ncbi:MAG: hypothetical protein HQ592_11705 [Planctomycetes bacterium]|nr:hypothetical protein [Planctomycetota bacterium]
MKKLVVMLAALSLAGLSFGDLIRFKDKLELGGSDVEVLWRKGEDVKVKVEFGTVTLKANRIESIRIDFDARVKKLVENGNDTSKNLFDLGVLCDQSQMPGEAAQAYTLAMQAPGVPDETLKRLAEVFEQRQMWHEAKAAYDRLLLTNPADLALQKKAASCDDMAKDTPKPEVDIRVGVNNTDNNPDAQTLVEKPADNDDTPGEIDDNDAVGPDTPGEDPGEGPKEDPGKADVPQIRDSLEANGLWRAEQWGSTATCEIVAQGDDDNKLLSITWTQRDKDKVAIRLSIDLDLTDNTKVTMDVYNDSDAPAGVGMAFNTLPGYQFFESTALSASVKKWTSLEIDLTKKKFKCAATNWRHTANIANKDNVKDIFVLIYNRNPNGTMFVDNVRFHTADKD